MIDTLCISGGGINGFCFIGTLEYLISIKYFDPHLIINYVGTSIGSILCFLLSIGYSIYELKNFILRFDFNLLENKLNIDNLFIHNGLNNGNKIIYILERFLFNKYKITDITFKEHFKLTNKKISIIGTNYTTKSECLFNYEKTPTMSILVAIRISISIPIIFTPVLFENNYYIDGGLTNNFPIKYCNINNTLGLCNNDICNNICYNLFSFIHGCCKILINNSYKDYMVNTLNIININNFFDNIINFNLDTEIKSKSIEYGKIQAELYINNLSYNICISILTDIINNIDT